MAPPTHQKLGDTSLIPFSPGDAARIRRTGELNYVERVPQPRNPTGFNLEDQLGRPILTSDIIVPARDRRGNPSAATYESWRKANHSRVGIPSNTYSIKGHGVVACLSDLERRLLSYCEMNPLVVEIRSQYPEWDRNKSHQRVASDERLLETEVMTIDFVLTLQIPSSRKVRYHAISCKPYTALCDDEVIRRHEREIERLSLWNCTHQIITEHSFTSIQDRNNQRLLQYMLHSGNVYLYADDAYQLAKTLRYANAEGDYDHVLTWAGKRNGWCRDEGYRLFGIAHFLGYMVCDHSHELLPETPVKLDELNRKYLPRLNLNLLPGGATYAYA